jgi:hypothetical protein
MAITSGTLKIGGSRLADWTTLRADCARLGLGRMLYRTLMSRLRPWLMLARLHIREICHDRPIEFPDDGIVIRVMTAQDFERACVSSPKLFDPEFVAAARARGDLCLAAYDGERLAAFFWRSFSTAPVAEDLWIRVTPPCRYGYKAFTEVDYRGRHLQQRLTEISDVMGLDRGCTHTVSFVETHNFPSLIAATREEVRLVGYAGYVRLFGRVMPFHSPGARRHGIRFARPDHEPAS